MYACVCVRVRACVCVEATIRHPAGPAHQQVLFQWPTTAAQSPWAARATVPVGGNYDGAQGKGSTWAVLGQVHSSITVFFDWLLSLKFFERLNIQRKAKI